MKAKKLISLLLCMMLMLALAVPAFAEKATVTNFNDIGDSWAKHEICLVADAGIVGGYSDGSFRPNAFITREAFAKVVSNFMGYTKEADISQYDDVDPNGNLTVFVARCVAAGVMGGYNDHEMGPKNFLTREQAAAMLRRAFKLDCEGLTANFKDRADITPKLECEIAALELTGLIQGYPDGNFYPKNNLSRAQMMAIISRLLPDNDGYFAKVSASAGDVTMAFDMLNDYSTELFVPVGEIAANKVDFTVKIEQLPPIKNLSPLVSGLVSAFMKDPIFDTIETCVDGTFSPKELLPAAYSFNFATIKATVNGESCTFNIYGREKAEGTTIIGTPTKSVEAGSAVAEVMDLNNIALNMFLTGNSASLANGSYVQIGTDKISFNDLLINLDADEATITDVVMNAVKLESGVASDGNQVTVFIKSGSNISTDKGTIALAKDVTVSFNGISDESSGILAELAVADATNIEMLASLFNELIASMDGHVAYVNVTIK